MVPLRFKLHSGDIVEILTQSGHKPSRDWLAIAKSSRARNKIKHWLNVHQRERAIEIGRKLIEKEARKYRISLKDIKDEELQKIASDYGAGRPDDLMAGIGYGKYSARQILGRMAPVAGTPLADDESDKPSGLASVVRRVFGGDQNNNAIRVKGHGDLLVYRARCCNPIRGEAIVGYVTRGKGVAVHAINCPNVTNLLYEPERRIDVEWAQDDGTPSALPGKTHGLLRRSFRDAQTNHCCHQRYPDQHPQHRSPHQQRPGERGHRARYRRLETPGKHRNWSPQNPRRTRRSKTAEDLEAVVSHRSRSSARPDWELRTENDYWVY